MSASQFRVAVVALVASLVPVWGVAQTIPGEPLSQNYDFQVFEPFDLDLDGQPVRNEVGYFFRYDKLYWNVSGERREIGAPGALQQSEIVFPFIEDDLGPIFDPITMAPLEITSTPADQLPQPFNVPNGIQDGAPDSEYAYGERYEFGFSNGESGILVGILDGPAVRSDAIFGFGSGFPFSQFGPDLTDLGGFDIFGGNFPLGLIPLGPSDTPGINGFFTGTGSPDSDGNGIPDGNGPQSGDFRAFGFGSVPVAFEAPAGFFFGFRDYLNNIPGAAVGTQRGIIASVLNSGSIAEDDTDDDDADFEFVLGVADDLDGDGILGGVGTVLAVDAMGNIVTLATITDFDDLHQFNVFFDSVQTLNNTESQGVELMRTHVVDNRHWLVRDQNASLSIGYGARFFRLRDQFAFVGIGSIIGLTTSATEIDNQLIGPQLSVNYAKQSGKWRFDFQGRALAGYNIADISQNNNFGGSSLPGGLNELLFLRPTSSALGRQEEELSPLVELRLNSEYRLTNAVSLNLGYTLTFIDNIHRAANATLFQTPGFVRADGSTSAGFGIGDGRSDIIINGVNFGLEARY